MHFLKTLSHSYVSSASIWSNYIQIQEFFQGKGRRTEPILSERLLTITCVIQTRMFHSLERENKSLTVLGTETEFVKRHLMEEKLHESKWKSIMERGVLKLLFCSSSMTFGLFFLFLLSWRCILFFLSLVPSSHWSINSENNERPRCSREVLSVWEVWRGWTCRGYNQPDDKMSGHPTGFPDLTAWQIEGG